MKFNYVVLLAASSLMVANLPISSYANPSPVIIAQKSTGAKLSGKFIGAEKPATGTAKIITEGGHRYLELDAAFSTSNQGPDLHVLLDTAAKPPQTYKNLGATVNLGKLKSFTGAQRYAIPDVINLAQFKSVVIWCRMANATFAVAPLK